MRFLLAVVFFGACQGGSLKAQQGDASSGQQPTPPYLAPVPANLHWIVTFSSITKTDPGTAPVPPPADCPVSVETIKVGNLRRVTVKFANGPSQQFDISDHDCFAQTSAGLECRKLDESYMPYLYCDLGFAFTQCVKLASFKQVTTYQSVPTFHYQNDTTEAWISVSTLLPIGADLTNTVKTSYQYLPTPATGDVVLTSAEQKILQYRKLGGEIYKNMR